MALAGDLVDELLRRVRDPQGTANPRALVFDYLDRAQVLFVRATTTVIIETTLTLTESRLVYDIDAQRVLRVLDCFVDDLRLWPVAWAQMQAGRGPQWWRTERVAGPRVWAPLGTTHLVVYPAPDADLDLTLRYQERPATLAADADPMQLPDEFFPRLLDFVEAALYVRQRDVVTPEALARLEGESAPETAEVA